MRSQFIYISVYNVGHAPFLPTYLPKQFTMETTNQRLETYEHLEWHVYGENILEAK